MLHSWQRGSIGMIISEYTVPELDYFRRTCNFVGTETAVFELRSKGIPLKTIASQVGMSIDGVKKVSMRINRKINHSLSL